jgi:hypothetical protein
MLVALLSWQTWQVATLWSRLKSKDTEREHHVKIISLFHVQMMNPLLRELKYRKDVSLIENPSQWLAPLKERINSDRSVGEMIKNAAMIAVDKGGRKHYVVYCNPVNDEPDPYEVFKFVFEGDLCTSISRNALYPW